MSSSIIENQMGPLPTVLIGAAAGGFVAGLLKKTRGEALWFAALGAAAGAVLHHARSESSVHVTGAGDGGLSFEDAWAHAEQQASIGHASGPDPIEKIRAELSSGASAIVSACAPETTSIVIKAAIQNGHAVGVSVYATPPNPTVSSCIASRVRRISFTASSYMDAVTASF